MWTSLAACLFQVGDPERPPEVIVSASMEEESKHIVLYGIGHSPLYSGLSIPPSRNTPSPTPGMEAESEECMGLVTPRLVVSAMMNSLTS